MYREREVHVQHLHSTLASTCMYVCHVLYTVSIHSFGTIPVPVPGTAVFSNIFARPNYSYRYSCRPIYNIITSTCSYWYTQPIFPYMYLTVDLQVHGHVDHAIDGNTLIFSKIKIYRVQYFFLYFWISTV